VLTQRLREERDHGQRPLFQVSFIMQKVSDVKQEDLSWQPVVLDRKAARAELELELIESGSSIEALLQYSTDMCDAQKMAPAAAHYIADRMAELGDDSQSMTLVLLSYNSGTDPVLDALRRLRETDANYERNFWTLFANRDKLSEGFRRESAGYVPAFFAAAIVGENPEAFELPMPALSSLAADSLARKP